MLEVSVPFHVDRDKALKAVKQVASQLDHKALGVDVSLAFPLNSQGLLKFLQQELEKKLDVQVSVQLERGDGFIFRS